MGKLLLAELSDRRREEVLDAMLVAHLDPRPRLLKRERRMLLHGLDGVRGSLGEARCPAQYRTQDGDALREEANTTAVRRAVEKRDPVVWLCLAHSAK